MTMDRRTLLGVIAGAATPLSALTAQQGRTVPPNIVLIVADDLGYGDLGVYGSSVNRTPNLDRLAKQGMRFTDFHSNGPMCSPTRASLMTGRYPQRFGRKFESALSGEDGYDDGLPLGTPTIARILKQAGYATAIYGKWHLGFHPPFLPTRFGFDDFQGLASGDGDHHSHIDRSGRPDWWHNETLHPETGYTADLVTRHSISFIERNRSRPFFLYVPHLAIHFPWQGPAEKPHRVEGKSYTSGSEKLGLQESKDISAKVRQMVEAVDDSVGRIVRALEQHRLTDRTLVFFTSDNGGYLTYSGGYHNISNNGPCRGQKGDVYEGGHRVPAIAWWPGRIRPGVSGQTAMSFDLVPTFAALAGTGAQARAPEFDGVNLNPLLFHQQALPSRTLFWRMHEKKAVRQGDWKLVVVDKDTHLFNLKDDIAEKTDLSLQHPEIKARLSNELARWEAGIDRPR